MYVEFWIIKIYMLISYLLVGKYDQGAGTDNCWGQA